VSAPQPEDRIALLEKEISELRRLLTEVARKQSWPQYVTKDELAEMLQISPRTVDDWVSEDRIPYHKAGSQTRFLIGEVVQWTAGKWKVEPKTKPARTRRVRVEGDKPQLRGL
jgi:excisionase family DNA binding protein